MTLKKLLPILNRLINYYSDLLYTVLDKSLINGNSMVFGRSDKIGTISIIFILAGRDLQTVSLKNDYSRSIGMITLETIILNYKDLIKKAYKSNETLKINSKIFFKSKEAFQLMLFLESTISRILEWHDLNGSADDNLNKLLASLRNDFAGFTNLFQILMTDDDFVRRANKESHDLRLKRIIKEKFYNRFLELDQILKENGFVTFSGKWKGSKSSFATLIELLIQNGYFVNRNSKCTKAPRRFEIKAIMEGHYQIEIKTLFEKKKLERFFAGNKEKLWFLNTEYFFPLIKDEIKR